jgi:predicted DNA-binding helix-hairpin-helix protein
LSANIELPTPDDLKKLAPEKDVGVIEDSMNQIAERWLANRAERRKRTHVKVPSFSPAGQSTQMIVGATEGTDSEILGSAARLYDRFKLRRVYYSAYSPIPHSDARLPNMGPPLVREHRLYQSDWLMRFYGFGVRELTTPEAPNLDLKIDPKLAWALRNRGFFPVDLNRDPRWRLLRVPGLGVRSIERIIKARHFHSLRLLDLQKLHVSLRKVRPFVLVADHNPEAMRIDRGDLPKRVVETQLNLFETATSAASGEI